VRLSTNAVQALCKLLRRFDLAIGGRDLGDLVDQDGGQRGTDAQRATGNRSWPPGSAQSRKDPRNKTVWTIKS
jgi:hypothetical protein